jgi:hypothetical protein
MEESDRLKEVASKPYAVTAIAEMVHNFPGLGLVGSMDANLAKIGEETLEEAEKRAEGQGKRL